jgi:hypothetical protein
VRRGDYEFEMGIGREPEFRPLLENPDMLIFAWGATVPMMAHAAGIEFDAMTPPGTSGHAHRGSRHDPLTPQLR